MSRDKTIYLTLAGAISLFSGIGTLLSLFDKISFALAFIGVAGALMPVFSHVRMRRTLAAQTRISKLNPAKTTSANYVARGDLKKVEDEIQKIFQTLRSIEQSQYENKNFDNDSIVGCANEIRREARMIRLVADSMRQSNLNEAR